MDPYLMLQGYLRPDEQLLWHGAPDQRVRFAPADIFLVPFSVMWCGFAVFWESAAIATGGSVFFVLWGIPFVAIGIYFVAGRFAYKRYRRRHTAYGITSQRALIAALRTVADIPLLHQAITVRRSRDGRHASVLFGIMPGPSRRRTFGGAAAAYYANTGMEPLARGISLPFAFYDVAEPDVMLAALEQARTQPAG